MTCDLKKEGEGDFGADLSPPPTADCNRCGDNSEKKFCVALRGEWGGGGKRVWGVGVEREKIFKMSSK